MKRLKTIKIFGDKYLLRKTFDIIDDCGGVDGFDVMDEDKKFLFHYDADNINAVISVKYLHVGAEKKNIFYK